MPDTVRACSAAALVGWLGDPTARDAAGIRARALVEAGLGAAERSFVIVSDLLDGAG